ncbi:unnamed protein product [Musa acuminata subsp. burmannicoides]
MERSKYWMWSRDLSEKPSIGSQIREAVPAVTSSYVHHATWEERAFAEDSAGHIGGYIWPPRSYSCSFCRREFRSAQALGGHMNVHRRDRARLKQSLSPTGDDSDHDRPHHSSQRPYMPSASPLSPRVSAASTPEVSTYALLSPSYSSSIVQENEPDSCLDPDLKLGSETLNLRDPSKDDEEHLTVKKRRTDLKCSSISMRSSMAVQQKLPCPVEELDLELRLGQKRKPVMVE